MYEEKFPKLRITVELIVPDAQRGDIPLGVYMYDRGRIAGDVYLNAVTPRHSFDVETRAAIITLGPETLGLRSVSELINREREWRNRK